MKDEIKAIKVALIAALVGCLVLGMATGLGMMWPAFHQAMVLYKPTGSLSGKTTLAVVAWLLTWMLLKIVSKKRH